VKPIKRKKTKNKRGIVKLQSFQGGEATLKNLIQILIDSKYQVIGPQIKDQEAIVFEEITGLGQWPKGFSEVQIAGYYQLVRRTDQAYFGFTVGPNSLKNFLFPAREKLFSVTRKNKNEMQIHKEELPQFKRAFLGVRACDVQALKIQDQVFLKGQYSDSRYLRRRQHNLIIAINCGEAQSTCFCTSMGGSPRVKIGADILITEKVMVDESQFYFQAGTELGLQILKYLEGVSIIEDKEFETVTDEITAKAILQMQSKFDNTKIKDALYAAHNSPLWESLAQRCLSCANCTMVCPTCFCSSVEDVTDLKGDNADRWRKWESCFSIDHSYLHGQTVRKSVSSRYRQWLTHKLGSWWGQFGSSGCTGCGRCVTWCPVGIDLSKEAAKIIEEHGGEK
jgi:ferredoxin